MRAAQALVMAAVMAGGAWAQDTAKAPEAPKATENPKAAEEAKPIDWRLAESAVLRQQVQLTFPEQFAKAGESYFSPDGKWIIFQAVAREEGRPADSSAPFAMYVAKVKRDASGSQIVGLEPPIVISAPGSANTCGFFHPTEPGRILFGSTRREPKDTTAGGFQRGNSRYKWAMPNEMEVVSCIVPAVYHAMTGPKLTEEIVLSDEQIVPTPLFKHDGYDAECAYSPDGRFVVYASAKPDDVHPDLYVFDTTTNKSTPIVTADGYDGGPFFSPDGKRICYRSDRVGNDLLQLYIADLKFDETGAITGIERETQLTANEHVNWAPFWHPSGEYLVYATSQVGHSNYEVFAIAVPPAAQPGVKTQAPIPVRVTSADGFDGLPVFDAKGQWLMWTSQRGGKVDGEERPSSQIWAARVDPSWRPGG